MEVVSSINQRWLVLMATLAGLLLSAHPVLAHGYLIRSIPEDQAVLERAPARLQYWFSEPLERQFSSLTVRDQSGQILAEGGTAEDNSSLLTVRLPRDLPDGAYIVDMRLAFASDGHIAAQSRVFFVGQAVSGLVSSGLTTQVNGVEAVWRTLALSSAILLFGTFTLYANILVPAWGNKVYRAGLLPPRVMGRLNAIVIGAFIVAFLGNGLALVQQGMAFFNADLAQVISQNLWSVVRVATRFGDLWNARMLLLGLAASLFALSLYWREEQPETVRPFWVANVWVMALVIGSFSAGNHAFGSPILPWVAIFNDWLHGLAVAFWAGGLGALALVLPPALSPYEGEARRLALLAAVRRFSRLAAACVAIVIATGIYSALNWIHQPADLTQTPFGGALVVKLVLVAGLLLIGLMHYAALHPERFQRWKGIITPGSLRLEALFALGVVASAGLLSASPVPIPYFIRDSIPSPQAITMLGDLSVSMAVAPGGPGVNTYDVLVTRGGQPLDGLSVRIQWVNPGRDKRSEWQAAESADSGLYVAAGGEVEREGHWWTLVDIRDAAGMTQRAAFDWDISAEAAVQQTIAPGFLNILALLGVLAALGWVFYPWGVWIYHRLDLSPASVTIALSAILAAIFFIGLGFVLVQNGQVQYEATLNPPPKIINLILPDAASLARGQALYNNACPDWQGRNLKPFIERLPRTRDEELFAAVQNGWQGIQGCGSSLSPEQRWDVVNYLRTFENL